jgi:anion transporter
MNSKKFGLLAVVVVALLIALIKPFSGLAPQGHHVLAVIIVSVALWIFREPTLPFFAGAALLIGGSLVFGIPLPVVAGGFVSPAFWTLLPAFFFGFALSKSGLGKRIAYLVLKTFKPSYLTILVSWFIIGVFLSILTPSITVRFAIVIPIAMSVAAACKLADRSRGTALITFAAWGGALFPGTAWLTGALTGPLMMGFYPDPLKPLVNFNTWFQYMSVPWFLITLFFFIGLYLFFKPKEPLELSVEIFRTEYEALGPITRIETTTGIILLMAMVLFTTERWHGMSTASVALLIFFALMIFKVINFQEIGVGINWDIICFFGAIVSLMGIVIKSGIGAWLKPMIEPAILSLAGTPLIFLLVLTIVYWAIRFVDVPWGFCTLAIAAPIFIPLYEKFGLHPALVTVVVVAASYSFFLPYQQPFIMMGEAMSKSRGWEAKHVSIAGAIYAVSVLLSILLSSIYWKAAGLMP